MNPGGAGRLRFRPSWCNIPPMRSGRFLNTARILRSTAVLVCALALTGWARYRLETTDPPATDELREVLLVPPGEVIRRIDLGYHTQAADWLFLWANLYYGHHMYTDERFPWLADFIDILIDVDPDFEKAYLWGAMVTVYNRREIDFVPAELVERANRLLLAGMDRFPEKYIFPMRIAFNLYYELGDPQRAIPYFVRASKLPGAPGWLKKKALDLYSKKGDKQLAREMVTAILAETGDQALSDAMHARLQTLLKPEERERLTRVRERLLAEWRSDFEHLPYDLFLLVREP